MNKYVRLLCVLALSTGCTGSNISPTASHSPSGPGSASNPFITSLPDDAAVLRKLMGYPDVVAYEFRGTWLECWLECEVDGEVVARTPHEAVSPDFFGTKANVGAADSEDLVGWITVWGADRNRLNMMVRAELPRGEGRTSYPFTLQRELEIPQLDTEEVRKGGLFLSGSGLETGWTELPLLPDEANEPVVLRSYEWVEESKPDQKLLRTVRVMLYCQRPQLGDHSQE